MPIIWPKEPHSATEISNRFERQVPGLRSAGRAGPVTVFEALPDGNPGRYLRTEPGKVYEQLLKSNKPRIKE